MGAFFLFCMLVLLVYQAIKMQTTPSVEIKSNWNDFLKSAYILGLVGPILDWIFIFFLIKRANDKVRAQTNPGFLDTESRDVDDYEDNRVLKDASDEIVYYEDNRMNYQRPYRGDSAGSPKDVPDKINHSGPLVRRL